jgi:hypothetical protein
MAKRDYRTIRKTKAVQRSAARDALAQGYA